MAKKSKIRSKKAAVPEIPENMLPQNILPIGERVEENKNIYISQAVYKDIHKFTKNKTTNESGGMLVGSIIEEFGKTNIVISGFVEAKHCEATPTTLKFTHETWEYVHKEIDKKHKGKKIVGWIHTHPDFGIFLSEYDKFIHQNFFNEDYQVAYVVDPIQNIEGFYFWINGKIEKCKGFYIYDKTGVKIDVDIDKDEPMEEAEKSLFNIKNILLGVLSVVVVFLIFSNISTNNKLEQIEEQQKTLADSANQSLSYMQQLIWSQATEIDDLNDEIERLNNILIEAGIIEKPIEPSAPEGETDSTTTDSNDTSTDEITDNTSTESSDNQETTVDSNVNQEATTGTNEEGGNTGE